ncbi:hypothetical protein ACFLXB_03610 [Chloroflexota bacterium]
MNNAIKISNSDLIPIALYDLGGVEKFVDIEDIFYKCYDYAPSRIKWRKYNIPNYKTAAKALQEFEAKHPGYMIKTADGLSRKLTVEGIEWINNNLPRVMRRLSIKNLSNQSRRPQHRILKKFFDHKAFQSYQKGITPDFDKYSISELFLCAPDSPPSIWKQRFEDYRLAANDSGNTDILNFLELLKEDHPDWFDGGTSEKQK